MMPGLLSMMLCGEQSIDPTAAGTMMAMEMARRARLVAADGSPSHWSDEVLALAGLDASFFPHWVEPGEVIGEVSAERGRADRAAGGHSGGRGGPRYAVRGGRLRRAGR
jgi:sugar (pentulose or hexulose) kinase